MTKINAQESEMFKKAFEKIHECEEQEHTDYEKLENEIKELKKEIECLKEYKISEEKIINAYNSLRLDVIMGMRNVSKPRLRELIKYMDNVDVNNIPLEIAHYMKGEKK